MLVSQGIKSSDMHFNVSLFLLSKMYCDIFDILSLSSGTFLSPFVAFFHFRANNYLSYITVDDYI